MSVVEPEELSSPAISTRDRKDMGVASIIHQSSCRDTHRTQDNAKKMQCTKDDNKDRLPIAIVGMAMRLPGGVNSADAFWNMLVEGKDGHCEVPGSRYSIDGFYSSYRPRSVKSKHGYFLQQDPGHFDADFFSIHHQEAERMDPQQRMLLEIVWECLENAGQTDWCGKDIGCYVGVFGEDWLETSLKDPQEISRFHPVGTGQFALANRVSYEFDFRGPSMTVLTACSSSLVALHEACQALSTGECSSAIVAGANLIQSPTMTGTLSDNFVLSPSGFCRTFDKDADGYGRGEAINAVYVKPLSQAIKDNDPVYAVIRSTATNSDGKTPNITTPGTESLVDLVRQAYRRAGLNNVCETGFFECHGTGTTVGDVSETSMIAKIFQEKGIIIGSVKPNIGHAEGASGINSLIKAALALQHRTIPPNAHFRTPNPNIPWEQGKLQVPVEPMPWPSDRKERVSVNCFGIGGTNVHVILDSTSSCGVCPARIPNAWTGAQLLLVSAKSDESLRARISDIAVYANNHLDSLSDLAYTLGRRRAHLKHRAFLVVSPNTSFDGSGFMISASRPREIIFVFTGQGSQWFGMGNDLLVEFPSFRADIEYMDRILKEVSGTMDWSISEQLAGLEQESRMDEAEVAQPLCTAIQIGLVNLLSMWGIRASAVVGHSSGEIAAAYASGAITVRSAIILAFFRGRVAKSIDGKGAMAAVGLAKESVTPYLLESEDAEIACENSPYSVTISGNPAQVSAVVKRIQEDRPDTLCRLLRVKVAYHSHQMLTLGQAYEEDIRPHVKRYESMRPMFSSVTGVAITDPKELDAAYWRRNLESPVLFHTAIQDILSSQPGRQNIPKAFIELGPHPVLFGPLQQTFIQENPQPYPVYIPTLTRKAETSARAQLLTALGNAFIHNLRIDLSRIIPSGNVLTDLPSYPWQHDRSYLRESRVTRAWKRRHTPHHELLGSLVAEVSHLEPSWRNILRLEEVPWLADHVIHGHVIFPAACYIAMAGEAVQQLKPNANHFSIQRLTIKHALILKDTECVELITSLKPVKLNSLVDSDWYSFSIMSHGSNGWVRHCNGEVRPGHDTLPHSPPAVNYARTVQADQWYRVLDRCGLSYGQSFQGLTEITTDPNHCQAAAAVNIVEAPGSRYTLHPIVIDQCLQLLSVAASKGISRHLRKMAIPTAIESLFVAPGAPYMKLQSSSSLLMGTVLIGNATLTQGERVVLSMSKASLFPADGIHEKSTPTAQIQWAPDIDLVSTSNLLGRVINDQEFGCDVELLEKAFLLQVLKTDNRIQEIDPHTPGLANWKRWVNREAERIRQGKKSEFPESQIWSQWDQTRLQSLFDSICTASAGSAYVTTLLTTAETLAGRFGEYASGERSPIADLAEANAPSILYERALECTEWGRFLSLLGHSKPTMRILEVGAGTGCATARALTSLEIKGVPIFSSYTFTDLVPEHLTAAEEKFQSILGIEYKRLDITSDPLKQGFERHSYDLVIASNTLGTLSGLRTALRHIKDLLTASGHLLLHEFLPDTLCVPFIMGLLPSWLACVNDQPDLSLYLSPERWDEELKAAGFSGTKSIAYDTGPPYRQTFSMISQIASIPTPVQPVTLVTIDLNSTLFQSVSCHFLREHIPVCWNTLSDDPPEQQEVIFLLDVHEPFLYNMSEESYDALHRYILKLKSPTLWITRASQITCVDPRFGLTAGFIRSLRHELQLDISFIEIDDMADPKSLEAIVGVYRKIHHRRERNQEVNDFEFAIINGTTHISRLEWTSLSQQLQTDLGKYTPKMLQVRESLMDKTYWTQIHPYEISHDQIDVEIRYVALNFKDIMMAMGLLGSKLDLGIEATGTVCRVGQNVTGFSAGDRVAIFGSRLFRTHAIVDPRMCRKLPSSLSLEEGATIPVAYGTAIYSLLHVGLLRRGQSVLIHSACGGVGLASIAICRLIGAEIFCTVGSDEKACYLTETLGIPRGRIFDSRSVSFHQGLMHQTNGRGVDIVLNSLSGKLLHASWKCVAPFGKLIELGKQDLLANGTLQMNPFLENRSFCGVDLAQLAELNPDRFSELLSQSIGWFEEGKIHPIVPVTLFEAPNALDALRYMQTGSHMGKILVRMPADPDELPACPATPLTSFSSDMSYLLVGGLGGIGRAVSRWMVENGARHITYLSRSAGSSAEHQSFILELKLQGCNVIYVEGDVGNLKDVHKAVSVCERPLSGIMQLSTVLRDHAFTQMAYDDWKSVLKAKLDGTWNLHHATHNIKLDFFVLFSSISGLRGNIGQANYAAASTFLDSFNLYRQQLGLPSTVIDLGVVEDVGLVSRDSKLLQAFQSSSIYLLQEGEVIDGLQLAISLSQPMASSGATPLASRVILGHALSTNAGQYHLQHWVQGDARYSKYLKYDQGALRDPQEPETTNQLKTLLSRAKRIEGFLDNEDNKSLVRKQVISALASLIPGSQGMDEDEISGKVIDSLMAIEARTWLRRNTNIEFDVVEISKAGTIGNLAHFVIERIKVISSSN
ncbi:putative polyketide synthase [Aspergillus alliaceus]|uniref:Putative polyketide synthase n=1 Tax=Petromyces alliaceus TaxID=209559 RepID=A0A5N7CAG8_PETAA|nr:putative polyketide synthase [Aspergillus alliaceus]